MKTPNRAIVARLLCDAIAISVGFFAMSGAVLLVGEISSSFFVGLLWLSLVCGTVVGLGFGVSQSSKTRRWLGVPLFAMCVLHLAVQGRLFALGEYSQLTTPMCVISFISASLLLCWLADRLIQRHIRPSSALRLKYRVARAFSGLTSAMFVATIFVGCYMCVQLDDLPKQLLFMLMMVWNASLLYTGIAAFSSLTCPKQVVHIPSDSLLVKFAGAGFACHLIGSLGYAMQGGQPTMLVALPMIALAAIIVMVVERHKFDDNKPLAFCLVLPAQQPLSH